MQELTPRQVVQKLDEHIIGQDDAKRAVADCASQSVALEATPGRNPT